MGEAARPPATHYAVANLVAGLMAPWRAPRGRARLLVPAWRRLALPGVVAAALVVATMVWVDAPLMRAVTKLPVAQRKRLHGLPAQRADIIAAGLLVLESIALAAGAHEVLIVQADLLTGYLLEHAGA